MIIYASDGHSSPFNFHFISPLTHVVLEIDDARDFFIGQSSILSKKWALKNVSDGQVEKDTKTYLVNSSATPLSTYPLHYPIVKKYVNARFRLNAKRILTLCNAVISGDNCIFAIIA